MGAWSSKSKHASKRGKRYMALFHQNLSVRTVTSLSRFKRRTQTLSFNKRYVHTVIDNQQGPTVYYRECCSMLCGCLDGKGIWGRIDTWICMAESLCWPPETVTALLIGYTPIQNKKLTKTLLLYPYFCPNKLNNNNNNNNKRDILMNLWPYLKTIAFLRSISSLWTF